MNSGHIPEKGSDPFLCRDPEFFTLLHILRARAPVEADAPPPLREARRFAYVLKNLPIGIEPGESLAGDFGRRFASPELLSEVDAAIEARASMAPPPSQTPRDMLSSHLGCRAGWTPAHTCADYERVINEGLCGVLDDVAARSEGASGEELVTLQAMQIALEAVCNWASRYGCEHVPRHPARTFHEAVQAVWLVHAAVGMSELSDSSLSLGRLDQYLYPLYLQDLAAGVPEAELEQTLYDLWLKLNRFGDPACAVNLGGVDADGRDLFNPLSELVIRVSTRARLPSPILAARIHDGLSDEAFDLLTDRELFTMGQPTFYGEEPCREAMVRRGVPAEQAHRFAVNSCMGLVMPGEEISDMWGAVLNMLLPLELALNGGCPFAGELPVELTTPPRGEYESFDALFEQFVAYLDELAALLIGWNAEAAQRAGREMPNPFFSALTRDCITRARDRADGGARYHCVIVEGFGWCNAADALTAIRELVFEHGRHALQELVEAAQADFAGHGELLAEGLACPKFGNASEPADPMARRVTEAFAGAVSRHSTGNRYILPSYHTLNAHVAAGASHGASLDGRRAGEPFGKNVGPMLGRAREGLTSILLSASALDQPALSGGQALDISIDPNLLRGTGRRKLQSLLRTYFQRGGMQIQVNGVSADDLRAAIATPERHRDLLVRIAGYSARFVTLPMEVQTEMVERFKQGQ